MAPNLSEDEIDDLIYFARAGETAELNEALVGLSSREGVSTAQILVAAKDNGKSTCLHMATGNGNLEIVSTLLTHFKEGVPAELKKEFLDTPNEFGNTGLHWAAMGGHLDVVKLLIAEGASPALANDKNYIPLDLASFAEKMNVVDYFLGQMKELEGENEGEGLENAAEALEVGGAEGEGNDEVEVRAESNAEEAKPASGSS